MAVEKALFLALLVGLILLSQGVALADKGGNPSRPVAVPSVNLGLATAAGLGNSVGLPAGAMVGRGAAGPIALGVPATNSIVGKGSSAQLSTPGAARSASSAGLTPPGKSKQASGGTSDEKSGEGKEKLASSSGTSTSAASDREARLNQLPTCR